MLKQDVNMLCSSEMINRACPIGGDVSIAFAAYFPAAMKWGTTRAVCVSESWPLASYLRDRAAGSFQTSSPTELHDITGRTLHFTVAAMYTLKFQVTSLTKCEQINENYD
jgi:hypothetical protein